MPYIILILVLLFGGMFTTGYLYYKDTQSTIEQLQANNVQLKEADEENQKTISSLKDSAAETEKLSKDLTKKLQTAQSEKDELINKLQKHNLTRQALKKPHLIETIVNNGTLKVFKELETITSNSVDSASG